MRQLRSIILAGGAGFVGSALARQLLATHSLERLVVLDKLGSTGNRGNLIGPDQDPRFHFVQGDIVDRDLVGALLREHEITGVFNLTDASGSGSSLDDGDEMIATNVTGTSHLLEICRAAAVPLLQCSTDAVYGSVNPPARFTELTPLNPSSPWAASQACGDLLCHAAFKTHRQDVVITRSSNNFGPRQHQGEFVPALVAAALEDRPLEILGDGLHIRDWIHVNDHCRGLLAAYTRGVAGAVYLFGGRCERTNVGMARSVLQVLGKTKDLISFVEDRPNLDRRCAVDFTRATGTFAWRPQHQFPSVFPTVVRELAANLNASAAAARTR